MLACVCQPADPNIFRHSPIPLGAAPLKITSKGAIPKVVPGRSIRITQPIIAAPSSEKIDQDENDSTESISISMNVPLIEPNREALLNFGGAGKPKEIKSNSVLSSETKLILSKFSPVKRKCTKKFHVKHKHRKTGKHDKTDINKNSCDKENLSLSSENAICDKQLKKQPEEFPLVRNFHYTIVILNL